MGSRGTPLPARIFTEIDWFNKDGILLRSVGGLFPQKGLSDPQIQQALNETKELPLMAMRLIMGSRLFQLFVLITLLLPERVFKKMFIHIIKCYVDFAFTSIRGSYKGGFIKPEHYCYSGQEIHRALKVMADKRKGATKVLIERFSLIFGQIWEFDPHYRWVFQDIFTAILMGKLSIDKVLNNPSIMFGLPATRDVMEDRRDFWRKIQKTFNLLLKFKGRFIKKYFREFMSEVDLKKVAFDEADDWYIAPYEGYNFWGLSLGERILIRQKIEGKYKIKQ